VSPILLKNIRLQHHGTIKNKNKKMMMKLRSDHRERKRKTKKNVSGVRHESAKSLQLQNSKLPTTLKTTHITAAGLRDSEFSSCPLEEEAAS
jgi:hypothetical protein